MIRKLISSLACLFLLLAAGCSSDDPFVPSADGDASLNLLIPVVDLERATRAATHTYTSATTSADEAKINYLHVIGFKTDGTRSHFHSKVTPEMGTMVNSVYRSYSFDVEPGDYNIYVMANIDPGTIANLDTHNLNATQEKDLEDAVKGLKKDYGTALPKLSDGLPMAGQPSEAVTVGGTTPVTAQIDLTFLCAKVRLTVIRDEEVGKTGESVTALKVNNVYTPTPLFSPTTSTTKKTITTGVAATEGHYAYDSRFSAEDLNLSTVSLEGLATTLADPSAKANVYQSVSYLPESAAYTTDDDATTLVATILGTDKDFPLGCNASNTTDHDEYTVAAGYRLTRGHFYDVVAKLNKGGYDIEWTITMQDWTPVTVAGELMHAELTIDKTKAKVDAKAPVDSVHYASNGMDVEFGCDEKYDGKPIISGYKISANPNTYYLRVNSEIPYSAFATGKVAMEGKVSVYLQCGNIKKYIDVEYDVTPVFTVTPDSHVISYDNSQGSIQYCLFEFESNLSDDDGNTIKLDVTDANFGDLFDLNDDGTLKKVLSGGKLRIELDDCTTKSNRGTIKVTLIDNPGENTLIAKIPLVPGSQSNGERADVEVELKPKFEQYYIYFRAINDQQNNDEDNHEGFNNPDKEDEKYKGWGTLANYNGANTYPTLWGTPNAYIYSQLGETSGTVIPTQNVWLFTGAWPGHAMTNGTGALQGWARYKLDNNMHGVNDSGDNSWVLPKPAETLIIFTRNNPTDNTRHRMAFAMEAGIQLFDFEDREGYYIFDPLCTPYNKQFDSRPDIVTVKYTLYIKNTKSVKDLSIAYGGASGEKYGIRVNPESRTMSGYNVYTFYAQCPQGYYAKSLKVNFTDDTSTTLFGGSNYYDRTKSGEANGIYEPNASGKWTWTKGKK